MKIRILFIKSSYVFKTIALVLVLSYMGSCSTDNDNELLTTENLLYKKDKGNKIDICHYDAESNTWNILNVNANSLDDHAAHGDVRLDDQDNDGTVPNNECGYGVMGDCDDLDDTVSPLLTEIVNNGIDDDCNPDTPDVVVYRDADADGYNELEDCNDHDPAVHPGASEILYNGIDDDCNPLTPDYADADLDGYTSDVDCDDLNPNIYPGAPEIMYNNIDDDCNPLTPDYIDADSDGVNSDLDCDDNNPMKFPGNPEICGDNIDQNCDGYDMDCSDGRPVPIR